MAFNIEDRLSRLQARRNPRDIVGMSDSIQESYQERSQRKATRYALGAMQAVDYRYTEICYEEAVKVQSHLETGLNEAEISAEYRMQGSVPLDVHIRGKSDVDLLVVLKTFVMSADCPNSRLSYLPYSGLGKLEYDVLHLRNSCETKLVKRFWGADVDTSKAKSIRLSGGGFRRDVDVVPASWFDSIDYQTYLKDAARGVDILDKNRVELIRNFPFLYMESIETKNVATGSGLKMAIRLLKNVKSDAEKEIELSSFDIGSIMYQCPNEYIMSHPGCDLAILSGADTWLERLAANKSFAQSLIAPDGTGSIISTLEKWEGLCVLSEQVGGLAREVEAEIIGRKLLDMPTRDIVRKNLRDRFIPLAA